MSDLEEEAVTPDARGILKCERTINSGSPHGSMNIQISMQVSHQQASHQGSHGIEALNSPGHASEDHRISPSLTGKVKITTSPGPTKSRGKSTPLRHLEKSEKSERSIRMRSPNESHRSPNESHRNVDSDEKSYRARDSESAKHSASRNQTLFPDHKRSYPGSLRTSPNKQNVYAENLAALSSPMAMGSKLLETDTDFHTDFDELDHSRSPSTRHFDIFTPAGSETAEAKPLLAEVVEHQAHWERMKQAEKSPMRFEENTIRSSEKCVNCSPVHDSAHVSRSSPGDWKKDVDSPLKSLLVDKRLPPSPVRSRRNELSPVRGHEDTRLVEDEEDNFPTRYKRPTAMADDFESPLRSHEGKKSSIVGGELYPLVLSPRLESPILEVPRLRSPKLETHSPILKSKPIRSDNTKFEDLPSRRKSFVTEGCILKEVQNIPEVIHAERRRGEGISPSTQSSLECTSAEKHECINDSTYLVDDNSAEANSSRRSQKEIESPHDSLQSMEATQVKPSEAIQQDNDALLPAETANEQVNTEALPSSILTKETFFDRRYPSPSKSSVSGAMAQFNDLQSQNSEGVRPIEDALEFVRVEAAEEMTIIERDKECYARQFSSMVSSVPDQARESFSSPSLIKEQRPTIVELRSRFEQQNSTIMPTPEWRRALREKQRYPEGDLSGDLSGIVFQDGNSLQQCSASVSLDLPRAPPNPASPPNNYGYPRMEDSPLRKSCLFPGNESEEECRESFARYSRAVTEESNRRTSNHSNVEEEAENVTDYIPLSVQTRNSQLKPADTYPGFSLVQEERRSSQFKPAGFSLVQEERRSSPLKPAETNLGFPLVQEERRISPLKPAETSIGFPLVQEERRSSPPKPAETNLGFPLVQEERRRSPPNPVETNLGFSLVQEERRSSPLNPEKLDIGFSSVQEERRSSPLKPQKLDIGFPLVQEEAKSRPLKPEKLDIGFSLVQEEKRESPLKPADTNLGSSLVQEEKRTSPLTPSKTDTNFSVVQEKKRDSPLELPKTKPAFSLVREDEDSPFTFIDRIQPIEPRITPFKLIDTHETVTPSRANTIAYRHFDFDRSPKPTTNHQVSSKTNKTEPQDRLAEPIRQQRDSTKSPSVTPSCASVSTTTVPMVLPTTQRPSTNSFFSSVINHEDSIVSEQPCDYKLSPVPVYNSIQSNLSDREYSEKRRNRCIFDSRPASVRSPGSVSSENSPFSNKKVPRSLLSNKVAPAVSSLDVCRDRRSSEVFSTRRAMNISAAEDEIKRTGYQESACSSDKPRASPNPSESTRAPVDGSSSVTESATQTNEHNEHDRSFSSSNTPKNSNTPKSKTRMTLAELDKMLSSHHREMEEIDSMLHYHPSASSTAVPPRSVELPERSHESPILRPLASRNAPARSLSVGARHRTPISPDPDLFQHTSLAEALDAVGLPSPRKLADDSSQPVSLSPLDMTNHPSGWRSIDAARRKRQQELARVEAQIAWKPSPTQRSQPVTQFRHRVAPVSTYRRSEETTMPPSSLTTPRDFRFRTESRSRIREYVKPPEPYPEETTTTTIEFQFKARSIPKSHYEPPALPEKKILPSTAPADPKFARRSVSRPTRRLPHQHQP